MPEAAPIRVLVVEEDPLDQALLHRDLRKTDMDQNVLFLSDPEEALELLHGPDSINFRRDLIAILLDEHFPHLSGTDLLRLIRSTAGMEGLPVIVMASSPIRIAAACEKLKVTALMEKPVTLDHFSKVIADLFHRAPKEMKQQCAGDSSSCLPTESEVTRKDQIRTSHGKQEFLFRHNLESGKSSWNHRACCGWKVTALLPSLSPKPTRPWWHFAVSVPLTNIQKQPHYLI